MTRILRGVLFVVARLRLFLNCGLSLFSESRIGADYTDCADFKRGSVRGCVIAPFLNRGLVLMTRMTQIDTL